jgi:hypothetical protein
MPLSIKIFLITYFQLPYFYSLKGLNSATCPFAKVIYINKIKEKVKKKINLRQPAYLYQTSWRENKSFKNDLA